jgi:hypothetical protein
LDFLFYDFFFLRFWGRSRCWTLHLLFHRSWSWTTSLFLFQIANLL